jgi:hypothetical protein
MEHIFFSDSDFEMFSSNNQAKIIIGKDVFQWVSSNLGTWKKCHHGQLNDTAMFCPFTFPI